MGRPRKKKAPKTAQSEIPAITEVPIVEPITESVKEVEIPVEVTSTEPVNDHIPESVKTEEPLSIKEIIEEKPVEPTVTATEIDKCPCFEAVDISEEFISEKVKDSPICNASVVKDIPVISTEAPDVFVTGLDDAFGTGTTVFNTINKNVSGGINTIRNNSECKGANRTTRARIIAAKIRAHRIGAFKSPCKGGVNAKFKLS